MRAHKVDLNQADIVECLRQNGAVVHIMSAVGKGFPDLVVGYRGGTHLIEIKMPGGKLTEDQKDWHAKWPAPVYIIHSVEEAEELLNTL